MQICCSRRHQWLNWFETLEISHFIHNSKEKTLYFSKSICYKCIFKNCNWINLRLKFKKFAPPPQKIQNIYLRGGSVNDRGGPVNDTSETIFWLPPIPFHMEIFVHTPRNLTCFLIDLDFPHVLSPIPLEIPCSQPHLTPLSPVWIFLK